MKYDSLAYHVLHKITHFITRIHWMTIRAFFNDSKEFDVTYEEKKKFESILRTGNFFILSKHKSYLSTYLICIMTLIKTKKWPEYCHILMNLDVGNPMDKEGFELMEATNIGVHYSTFNDVFDCDQICILAPKNIDSDEWTNIMLGLSKQLGKPYDDLFNIHDNSHVSCVEMVLGALQSLPNFDEAFPHLSDMLKQTGNLTPQMYRDCRDFEVIYETTH